MEVLLDDSTFRDPDGRSLPVAAMSLVCDAGNAVSYLLALSPHQQLQQRLLSLLEAIQPSDRIDASVLLPVIDAYEALINIEQQMNALPSTSEETSFLDGPLSYRDKSYYFLGENHYDFSSIRQLRFLITRLDAIKCADLLLLTERTSAQSFFQQLQTSVQCGHTFSQSSILNFTSFLAQRLGIDTFNPIANIHTISVLQVLYAELQLLFPWLTLPHVIAFFGSIIVKDRLNPFISDSYIFTANILFYYVQLLSYNDFDSVIEGYRFFQSQPALYEALCRLDIVQRMREIANIQTIENMSSFQDTSAKHIVCIAGNNHIPSVREGLGVSSAAV